MAPQKPPPRALAFRASILPEARANPGPVSYQLFRSFASGRLAHGCCCFAGRAADFDHKRKMQHRAVMTSCLIGKDCGTKGFARLQTHLEIACRARLTACHLPVRTPDHCLRGEISTKLVIFAAGIEGSLGPPLWSGDCNDRPWRNRYPGRFRGH